ncbi:Dabb family protein [Fodinibius sediminis]|uniref:Stress responsive A/B Barrel Domain n=1 Tax=Fodinibius sediminis TaxID=1214077 RepID=A0A521BP42_9BACT|nr:Dabb family protein [Fodinibius sediminis]SMO48914.1 Stress responsive A/B Barrel Domain [Fodinibius sediminis]
MKYTVYLSVIIALWFNYAPGMFSGKADEPAKEENITDTEHMDQKRLRHVVLIKFKENTSEEDIAEVEDAFSALPDKIPEIRDYEWGINNSPEGLNKGFTHCFLVTFASEEDRAVYLPHPDHKAFVEVLEPHLADVLVVDYWTGN